MPQQTDKPTRATTSRQTKSARIEVRTTPAQKQELMGKASSVGADLSEFMLAAALNKHLKPGTGDRQGFVQLLGELGKIGSNLNQIARTLNQGGDIAKPAIIRASDAVTQCADQIRSILSNGKL